MISVDAWKRQYKDSETSSKSQIKLKWNSKYIDIMLINDKFLARVVASLAVDILKQVQKTLSSR